MLAGRVPKRKHQISTTHVVPEGLPIRFFHRAASCSVARENPNHAESFALNGVCLDGMQKECLSERPTD
jgi:hypothetical protein